MDPLTVTSILASPKVMEVLQSLAKDMIGVGKRSLIRRLQPSVKEKAAKQAILLFAEEWSKELEEKCSFKASLPGYQDQFKTLIEITAAEIVDWMDPNTREVDLHRVEATWSQLKLDKLPHGFDWKLVGQNYARAIRGYINSDPELRASYDTILHEKTFEAIERTAVAAEHLAGPPASFDLTSYRRFLIEKKCNALQLAVMHTSTYEFGGKITLWSVFIEQSARESAPIHGVPPEIERRLHSEGHIIRLIGEEKMAELRKRYHQSPVRPALNIIERKRQVVLVGDPGSGKSSLLKYLTLRWAKDELGPIPLLIDLREYVKNRKGILEYCQSAHEVFPLSAVQLDHQAKKGEAAFYLDGLDEIFDPAVRQSVIKEIAVLSANYPDTRIVITSRKVGYEPEQLSDAGFFHATLEEFDRLQITNFIERWHCIAESDDEERAKMLKRLERAIEESDAIRELAGNPLLLTMMAILNRSQELPRRRLSLYREVSRVLLDDWDARKTLPLNEFDRDDKESLLREIAGEMQQAEGGLAGNLIDRKRLKELVRRFLEGISVDDSRTKSALLVKQLAERNFMLAPAGADRFAFVHRTFLEYYCAAWFGDRFQVKQDLTLEQLKENVFGRHWQDEKWHEVLRLLAGMLEEKAEDLIIFCMARDGKNEKLANLMLAVGCLNEVRARAGLHETADTLLQRLIGEAIPFNPPYKYDPWREFDETAGVRQTAVRWMALAWKSESMREWMASAAEQHKDWIIRQAAVQELARGWRNNQDTLPCLLNCARNDSHYSVRQAAVQELTRGWKDHPKVEPLLLKDRALNDSNPAVRLAAVQEMARGWKNDPTTLTWIQDRVRHDWNIDVRLAALQELVRGWKDEPNTLQILQDLLAQNLFHYRNPDYTVRRAAVQSFASGWGDDPEIRKLLLRVARKDDSLCVRKAALEAIVQTWNDQETFNLLRSCAFEDWSFEVRQTAIIGLAKGWKGNRDTLSLLQKSAQSDKIYVVRYTSLNELVMGWEDSSIILPLLHDRIRNDLHFHVRKLAAKKLAQIWKDDPITLSLLQERIRIDSSFTVRKAAQRELDAGWGEHQDNQFHRTN